MAIGLTEVLIAMSVPSGITAFCFWLVERRIQKRDAKDKKQREQRQKEVDERDAAREKCELFLIQSVGASMALAEATARAVQRIPDAKCNGDMTAALEYAAKVKHEQKNFLNEQAIKNIY